MSMSRGNLPNSTKVSDDMLALQRKRIAANSPQTDKLLEAIMNHPVWKTVALAYKEGLVNFVDTYKTLARTIHDMQGHKTPWGACPDPLCLINRDHINTGIGLIAKATELEPKEEKKS